MRIHRTTLSSLLILLAMTTALPGQATRPTGDATSQPILWPKTARPTLGITSFYTDFDGIHVPMLRLQSGGLTFEVASRKTLLARATKAPRYSGEFTDSRTPGISIGISVFDKTEFIPDLSIASWAAYKAGIQIEKPGIEFVLDDSNIDSPITPYVFGQQFRQIAYEQSTAQGVVKRREIFAFVGTKLVVFTVNGAKEAVDQNWGSVNRLISEFNLG